MKKILYLMLLVVLLFSVFGSMASAESASVKVYIDKEKIDFSVNPYIEDGTTMVPFRPIFESFGLQIGWDQETQTVTGSMNNLDIKLVIGDKKANVNGEINELRIAPTVIKGSTFVPLRFISEASDAQVLWSGETDSVFIFTHEKIENISHEFKSIALNAEHAGKEVWMKFPYNAYTNDEAHKYTEFENLKKATIKEIKFKTSFNCIFIVDNKEYTHSLEYYDPVKTLNEIFYFNDPMEGHDWTKKVWDTIKQRKVYVGMTSEMAELAWGKPEDINTTTGRWGTHEQWVYAGYNYLYFENGVLTTIQN